MRNKTLRNCILMGALGDAIGADIEFMGKEAIFREYGDDPVEQLLSSDLRITDDTQMTLFTLEGVSRALERGSENIEEILSELRRAYLNWFNTQRPEAVLNPGDCYSITSEPVLRIQRAPGNTCLSALRQGGWGSGGSNRINNSKGCGGVMRVAPVAFLPKTFSLDEVFKLGCNSARITHQHLTGYIAAGALVLLIRHVIVNDKTLEQSVESVINYLCEVDGASEVLTALSNMVRLVERGESDVNQLGEGWVAEQALAVGVFSVLREKDLKAVFELAALHNGDSDSTASIAGQIYGACFPVQDKYLDIAQGLDVGPLLDYCVTRSEMISDNYIAS